MKAKELLKKASDFIEANNLNLYSINIHPHCDCVVGEKIRLQGEYKENESFYKKDKRPFTKEDGYLVGRFNGIVLNLDLDE